MFLYYCLTYKAISSPLVAGVASAAAVAAAAVAEVTVAGGGGVDGGVDDLMRFRLRYFIFYTLYFHNKLQIIFKNLINSFLTSDISLQATF